MFYHNIVELDIVGSKKFLIPFLIVFGLHSKICCFLSCIFCSLMPDLLITCDRHVKFIVYYRELFARTFLSEDDTRGGKFLSRVLNVTS